MSSRNYSRSRNINKSNGEQDTVEDESEISYAPEDKTSSSSSKSYISASSSSGGATDSSSSKGAKVTTSKVTSTSTANPVNQTKVTSGRNVRRPSIRVKTSSKEENKNANKAPPVKPLTPGFQGPIAVGIDDGGKGKRILGVLNPWIISVVSPT